MWLLSFILLQATQPASTVAEITGLIIAITGLVIALPALILAIKSKIQSAVADAKAQTANERVGNVSRAQSDTANTLANVAHDSLKQSTAELLLNATPPSAKKESP